ncbi:hypothetical protein EYF80_053162 [Liparis tanakae]|uniref:Uncharacterized protein n=1 Tax=Liparis tanakae TaxID=230148 RepID=A0A4Z2F6I0_9TELE|nr:hypothetical protein EYF80_053162 [Liparis tanakae]
MSPTRRGLLLTAAGRDDADMGEVYACLLRLKFRLPGRLQHRLWEKGCLSSSSAPGRCLASTKMQLTKSRAESEVCEGSSGLVGCVAILNIAAMASYSAHGGFSVSISTTGVPVTERMPVPDMQMVCSLLLAPKSPSFTLPSESRRMLAPESHGACM